MSQMLWGECISGALYINDFLAIARRVGFEDPRELHVRNRTVSVISWPFRGAYALHLRMLCSNALFG